MTPTRPSIPPAANGAPPAGYRRSCYWKVVWTGGDARGDEAQRYADIPPENRVHTLLCLSLAEARLAAYAVGPGAAIYCCNTGYTGSLTITHVPRAQA
jgi:hypothetical protein